MNRMDQIKAAALDAAQHVTQDPAQREAMAVDLIGLIGLMIGAVGKHVAVNGESDLNEAEDFEDCESAQTRYLTGERIQDGARWTVEESSVADLSQYEDSKWGAPVWRPRCPDCGVRVGMVDNADYPDGKIVYTYLDHTEDCDTRKSSGITIVEWARSQDGHACNWVVARDGRGRPAMDSRGLSWQHCDVCGVHRVDCRCSYCETGQDTCPDCGAEQSHGTECMRGA